VAKLHCKVTPAPHAPERVRACCTCCSFQQQRQVGLVMLPLRLTPNDGETQCFGQHNMQQPQRRGHQQHCRSLVKWLLVSRLVLAGQASEACVSCSYRCESWALQPLLSAPPRGVESSPSRWWFGLHRCCLWCMPHVGTLFVCDLVASGRKGGHCDMLQCGSQWL
jgi:hypothetical protein